jgi:hypothetical protein
MTVKELKEKLENVQDDAKVMLIDMDSIWQSGRYDVEDICIENEGKTVLIM